MTPTRLRMYVRAGVVLGALGGFAGEWGALAAESGVSPKWLWRLRQEGREFVDFDNADRVLMVLNETWRLREAETFTHNEVMSVFSRSASRRLLVGVEDDVIAGYRSGASMRCLGARFGVGKETVRRLLVSRGVSIRR